MEERRSRGISFRLGPVESDSEDEWFDEGYARRLRGSTQQPQKSSERTKLDSDNNSNKSVRFADGPSVVVVESSSRDEGEGVGGATTSSNEEQQDKTISWVTAATQLPDEEETEPSTSSSSYFSDEDSNGDVRLVMDGHDDAGGVAKEEPRLKLEQLGPASPSSVPPTCSWDEDGSEGEEEAEEEAYLKPSEDEENTVEEVEEAEDKEDHDYDARLALPVVPCQDEIEYHAEEVEDEEDQDLLDTSEEEEQEEESTAPGTEVLDDAHWSNDNDSNNNHPTDSEYDSEPAAAPRRYLRSKNHPRSACRNRTVGLQDSEYEGEDSSFSNSGCLDELDDDGDHVDDDRTAAVAYDTSNDGGNNFIPEEKEEEETTQARELLAIAYGNDEEIVYEDADDSLLIGTADDEAFPDLLFGSDGRGDDDVNADRELPTSIAAKVLDAAFPDLFVGTVVDEGNGNDEDRELPASTSDKVLDHDDDPEDPPLGIVVDLSEQGEKSNGMESSSLRENTAGTCGEASEVSFEDASKQRKRSIYIMVGLCVASILLAACLGFLVYMFAIKDNGGDASPTPSNTTDPVSQDNATESAQGANSNSTDRSGGSLADDLAAQSLYIAIAFLSDDGGAAVNQSGTPQNLAFASVQSEALPLDQARLIQRYALRTFFYSTGGPTDWVNKTGWETTLDECLWFSHAGNDKCTLDGFLHTLEFDRNGLTGDLPPELSMLTALKRIFIKGSKDEIGLTMGIPTSLGRLSELTEFLLEKHTLKEPLPPNLFDNWSQAEMVNIVDCSVPGSLPSLGGLKSVYNLNLSGNRFKGPFPEAIPGLTSLKVFNIADNRFTGTLPATGLDNLAMLNTFSVAANFFTGTISSQFGNMVALKRYLDFSLNGFSGTIPTELNNLVNLERLILNRNQFSGSVPELSGLLKLEELSIEGTNLIGAVSSTTCAMLTSNSANATADCNRNGTGEVVCRCCTKCCVSIDANGQCLE